MASQGDKNTKYFHSRATKRYKKNHIMGIRDEMDAWRTQPDEISAVMTGCYQNLFTTSKPENPNNVLAHVPQIIRDEMNFSFTCDFMESKVSKALQQIALVKVPGLDGMPLLFYQHF